MTQTDWQLLKLQYALKRELRPVVDKLEALKRLRRNKPMLEEERWKIDYEIQGLQLTLEHIHARYTYNAQILHSPAGGSGGIPAAKGGGAC